jgi:hypothetical protein
MYELVEGGDSFNGPYVTGLESAYPCTLLKPVQNMLFPLHGPAYFFTTRTNINEMDAWMLEQGCLRTLNLHGEAH